MDNVHRGSIVIWSPVLKRFLQRIIDVTQCQRIRDMIKTRLGFFETEHTAPVLRVAIMGVYRSGQTRDVKSVSYDGRLIA